MYTVQVIIMPLKELLDPQGKAVKSGLESLGLKNISDVRVGKHITLHVNTDDANAAKAAGEEAAKKLLANAVMEYFEVNVLES